MLKSVLLYYIEGALEPDILKQYTSVKCIVLICRVSKVFKVFKVVKPLETLETLGPGFPNLLKL